MKKPERTQTVETVDVEAFLAMLPESARVYISQDNAEARLTGDPQRDDVLRLSLRQHPFIKTLEWLASNRRRMDHSQLVEWWRLSFPPDVYTSPDDLLTRLRGVTFGHDNIGTSTSTHGDEGLSRRIRHQITGTDTLPETFDLSFPIYPDIGETSRVFVSMALILHAEAEEFTIQPAPGSLDAARVAGLRGVRDYLAGRLENNDVVVASFDYQSH